MPQSSKRPGPKQARGAAGAQLASIPTTLHLVDIYILRTLFPSIPASCSSTSPQSPAALASRLQTVLLPTSVGLHHQPFCQGTPQPPCRNLVQPGAVSHPLLALWNPPPPPAFPRRLAGQGNHRTLGHMSERPWTLGPPVELLQALVPDAATTLAACGQAVFVVRPLLYNRDVSTASH